MRQRTQWQRSFTAKDLAREESRGMGGGGKSLGLGCVLFPYYTCPQCGHADIFVDVHPVEGETAEAFRKRRDELEATVRQMHGDRVDVVVKEK